MNYSFDTEEAVLYGLEEAIILSNLRFWITKNIANNTNFHDGYYWTYNSCKAFEQLYPFWNASKISRILKSLEEQQIIKCGNYNKSAYDRTKWYTIISEKALDKMDETILQKWKMDITNLQNPNLKNVEPITYINTDKEIQIEKHILSPDGQIQENLTNNLSSNKQDGQLFSTENKPKKKGENQYITVIENLSKNQKIRKSLEKYLSFRRKRGLTVEQWQLIVEKFKQESSKRTVSEIVQCIERCIIDGCNSLYYKQQNKNTNNTNLKSCNLQSQSKLQEYKGPSCFTL